MDLSLRLVVALLLLSLGCSHGEQVEFEKESADEVCVELSDRLEGVEDLTITIAHHATVVDHTALDGILLAMDLATDQPLQITGLDGMTPFGLHQSATRINRVQCPY